MRSLLFIFTCLLAMALANAAQAADDSLCSSQEAIVFNCSTGKKIISVCASNNLSRSSGYLQYRFGPKAAPEIQIPEAKEFPGPTVKSGKLAFAGGSGAYLRFYQGEYAYVVYTASSQDQGAKQGVAVEKGNQLAANILCKKPAKSEIGPKLFEKVGMSADGKGFVLP